MSSSSKLSVALEYHQWGIFSQRGRDKKSLEKFMPFMESRIRSEGCKGINHNKYLYTQCTRKVLEGGYCKICKKSADKNGGIPKYGSIEERKKCPLASYKPEKAKGAIRYLDVLSNNNITRKEMDTYAESIGVTIPDEIWNDDYERVHPGKGRKKKCVNGDEDKSPKKKRAQTNKEEESNNNFIFKDTLDVNNTVNIYSGDANTNTFNIYSGDVNTNTVNIFLSDTENNTVNVYVYKQ